MTLPSLFSEFDLHAISPFSPGEAAAEKPQNKQIQEEDRELRGKDTAASRSPFPKNQEEPQGTPRYTYTFPAGLRKDSLRIRKLIALVLSILSPKLSLPPSLQPGYFLPLVGGPIFFFFVLYSNPCFTFDLFFLFLFSRLKPVCSSKDS